MKESSPSNLLRWIDYRSYKNFMDGQISIFLSRTMKSSAHEVLVEILIEKVQILHYKRSHMSCENFATDSEERSISKFVEFLDKTVFSELRFIIF